ncbi:hypothetical protein KC330_g141 [Hortaea werneckii]|nr:hypothetical protein KC330_g141 [Hortaea werneckii]
MVGTALPSPALARSPSEYNTTFVSCNSIAMLRHPLAGHLPIAVGHRDVPGLCRRVRHAPSNDGLRGATARTGVRRGGGRTPAGADLMLSRETW